ncbi:hypothetical protein [Paraburkholderia guartelaensis]|uniref:DUF2892 domain-containing protein n=1 Tax=Paraburkholderia guartelaensis TaxID=2546446 RepID=A0ABU9S5F1_9BURK
MKLIEDGNFSGWMRITLLLGGVVIWVGGLALDGLPRWVRIVAFLGGFTMMALGGFSSRAHMLHIKPFDNSYKKARKSYEKDDRRS